MPIFSHSSFVQRAICWGLLIALILTGFLIPVLSLVTASRNGADLRARVLQAAATLDRKVAYVDGALLRLSSWEGHCGTELFRERRRELTMNPGVIDFLFLDAEQRLLCASEHEPEAFVARDMPIIDGLGYLSAAPSLLTGEVVFHLYRRLPSGAYVVARLPGRWLAIQTIGLSMPETMDYYGIIDSISGTPLNLLNWQPQQGLPHLSLSHGMGLSQTTAIANQMVQIQPLKSTPSLSLLHVSPRSIWAPLPLKNWLMLGLVFAGCWIGVTGGLLLMRRHALDPRRLLQSAMRDGEFFNVYQPIRDGSNGRLLGFEVLMRWRSSHGIIGPQHFIPMAEEQGLLVAMTRRQIDQAVSALAPLLARKPALKVSFNISSQHLLDPAFIHESVLWKRQIPHLVYEITEGSMVDLDDEVIGSALQRLKALGIRLAVDDFGTGYSSLAYLQRLPLDILKADRCFVAALGSDSINATILEAIVKLAHKLGLDIIAEGVEEEAQEQWLLRHGVVQQQGWRHGKPLTMAQGRTQWQSELCEMPT